MRLKLEWSSRFRTYWSNPSYYGNKARCYSWHRQRTARTRNKSLNFGTLLHKSKPSQSKQQQKYHSQLQSQQSSQSKEQNRKESLLIKSQIQDLKVQGSQKGQKVRKLIQMSETQTQLFMEIKESLGGNVQLLRREVTGYYDRSMRLAQSNSDKTNKHQFWLQAQGRQVQSQQQQLKAVKASTKLYESQRQQIRTYLQGSIQLSQHAIRRDQYEADRKLRKVENELTKTEIQRILSEALTPQIRSFLPKLIHNLQALKQLEDRVDQYKGQIDTSRQVEKALQQKLMRFEHNTQKDMQERQSQVGKLSMQLQKGLSMLGEQFKAKNQKSSQTLLDIQQIVQKNRKQWDEKFQDFIQKNRTIICQAVLQCKPTQQARQQQEILKAKIYGFQSTMEEVQSKVVQRCDDVLVLGSNIQAKLQLFHNRITKAKSDLKVQSDGNKKILQSYGIRMEEAQKKNQQESQVISKLLQLSILNTTLQVDQEYLSFAGKYGEGSHQTYVSFHDGFLLEITNDLKENELIYRKKRVNKEILKRTMLSQQAKLIDHITERLGSWEWTQQKQRPSQFFNQSIFPAYESMLRDKKQQIQARTQYFAEERLSSYNGKLAPKMMSPRKIRQSIFPPGSASKLQSLNLKSISKGVNQQKITTNMSIDLGRNLSSKQKNYKNQSMNQTNRQMYQTIDMIKPNRIKLKKIDAKEKESSVTKNRYSSNRETID